MDQLDVDGARAAVSRVAALPAAWTNTAERLVLMALACDSFDGETSAPGYDNLTAWTGMDRASVVRIMARLAKPNARRPSLLERAETAGGRRRTVWRLLLPDPVSDAHRMDVPSDTESYPQPVSGEHRSNRRATLTGMGWLTGAPSGAEQVSAAHRKPGSGAHRSLKKPLTPVAKEGLTTDRASLALVIPGQLSVHEVIDEIRLADPPTDDPTGLEHLMSAEIGPCVKCYRKTHRYGPTLGASPLCVACRKARTA